MFGSEGTDTEAEVMCSVAASANVTGLTIGDIGSIAKNGHQVLWIAYKDADDSGKPAVQPQSVYVERVYDEIDVLAALGF